MVGVVPGEVLALDEPLDALLDGGGVGHEAVLQLLRHLGAGAVSTQIRRRRGGRKLR